MDGRSTTQRLTGSMRIVKQQQQDQQNDIFAWHEWAILVVDTSGNASSSVLIRNFGQR